MKKLLALLLALAMVFSLMTCLTACGEDETGNNEGSSQSSGGNNNEDNKNDANEDNKNDSNTDNNDSNAGNNNDSNTDSNQPSTFTLQGVKFSVIGEYKESLAPSGTALALRGDSFSITVNYHDATSYADTEEATKSNYNSYKKAYPDATLELLETEDGIFYYTVKGWEYGDEVHVEYVHEGKLWDFSTGSFTDEAIYAITHITFG